MNIFLNGKRVDDNKYNEFIYVFFKDNEDDVYITSEINEEYIKLKVNNKVEMIAKNLLENQEEIMSKAILLKLYNINVAWGALIGVRPTKLVFKLLKLFNYEKIKYILKEIYLVSDRKIDLLFEIVRNSIKYIDNDTISVYIGLAYCPTKCTYCSFPAYLKKGKYLEKYQEYFETILKEIEIIGQVIKKLDLKINSIYIGGGTPSYLSEEELRLILLKIKEYIYQENILEYTFEAGRIDTINEEKLKLLKEYKVTRISINPQSFKESTLKLVNRYHNIDKLNEVYTLAKEMKFQINMDYIIGLPLEFTEDILNTLEISKKYDPENVTFHYLAMKKASNLNKENRFYNQDLNYKLINERIFEIMKETGYIPYYMYRQKNSFVEGENLGFCKPDTQLIYNIEMIEENKTVISIGAGSITKLISKNEIKRVVSPKDPLMWLNEFEQRIKEKVQKIEKWGENEKNI